MSRLFRHLTFVLLFLTLSSAAKAQWLVYELRFKEEAGSVNFSFYTGAYVVAPIGGGAASVVFTTEDGGNYYAVSQNSLRYYFVSNAGATQAALSALSINGTAQAFYSAAGSFDSSVAYTENGVSRTGSAASQLAGMLLASDDESTKTPAADGSLGMIGRASIAGTLRQDLTQIVNQTAITMNDSVSQIVGLLEKYGYKADEGDVPSGTTSTTTQPTAEVEQPDNSDVSALFGGAQSSPTTPVAPATAEVIQTTLLPPVGKEEN